jgi:hypothetical protein
MTGLPSTRGGLQTSQKFAPYITRPLLEPETGGCWRSRRLKFPDVRFATHYSSFCVLTCLASQERRLSLFLSFRVIAYLHIHSLHTLPFPFHHIS